MKWLSLSTAHGDSFEQQIILWELSTEEFSAKLNTRKSSSVHMTVSLFLRGMAHFLSALEQKAFCFQSAITTTLRACAPVKPSKHAFIRVDIAYIEHHYFPFWTLRYIFILSSLFPCLTFITLTCSSLLKLSSGRINLRIHCFSSTSSPHTLIAGHKNRHLFEFCPSHNPRPHHLDHVSPFLNVAQHHKSSSVSSQPSTTETTVSR